MALYLVLVIGVEIFGFFMVLQSSSEQNLIDIPFVLLFLTDVLLETL